MMLCMYECACVRICHVEQCAIGRRTKVLPQLAKCIHLLVDLQFRGFVRKRVQSEMKRLQVGEVGAVHSGLHVAGEAAAISSIIPIKETS